LTHVRRLSALVCVLVATLVTLASAQSIPTPSEFLNVRVGGDGVLISYDQAVAYWKAVAGKSDRITIQELGQTSAGLSYVMAIVTSPENQKKLEYYRGLNNRLYDPRQTTPEQAKALIAEGKTIVAIQMAIHATEVGSAQLSTELAYRFATDQSPWMKDVLDHTIILLSPSHNPDGMNMVAEWNRKLAGTKLDPSTLPFLYHKYVGHDDNRDWYMFTQKESQISVEKIWNAWHPQISYDLHQMGSTAARIFTPPYVDPWDPNVDPIVRANITWLGAAMADRIIGAGKPGVALQAIYDAWTPARGYVNYHGGVRMLTEAASVKLANPVDLTFDQLARGIGYDAKTVSWNFPQPWHGGTWRLRDIMDYEQLAIDGVLEHAARNREQWLANFYRVNANAIGRTDPESGKPKPYAIVIPAEQKDQASTFTMLWALQFGDVEISRATAAFTAGGRAYPAGSHVILMAQPASSYAKTLTEIQHYPDLRQYPGGPPQRPYDVTAYTMPLMMGVEAVTVQEPFQAALELVKARITLPAGTVAGVPLKTAKAYVFRHDNGGLMALNHLAQGGLRVEWASAAFTAGGREYPAGTMIVPLAGQPKTMSAARVHQAVAEAAKTCPVEFVAVNDKALPPGKAVRMPRIGMYKSYVASMDEGWTRWLFEQWDVPFTSLENKDVRAGGLRAKYDVVILPQQDAQSMIDGHRPGAVPDEYAGGLGQEGVAALKEFTEAGGTLIALDSASMLPIQQFGLSVKNVVADTRQRGASGGLGPNSAAFYGPGSILKSVVDVTSPIAYGAEPEGIVWFEQSPAFEVSGTARAIVSYPAKGPVLLSGWLLGGETLNGRSAIVEAPLGKGRVVLFGFRPQYRAQTWSTFKYLFNALYYATMDEAAPPTKK
jgi:Zinc carboxypeptidase